MVGGVKATFIVLLALVLIVDGAKVLSGQNATEAANPAPYYDHAHDHDHLYHPRYQPLVEMLPPIGPIGIVAIGVFSDLNRFILGRPDQGVPAEGPPGSWEVDPSAGDPNTGWAVRPEYRPPEPDGARGSPDTNGS